MTIYGATMWRKATRSGGNGNCVEVKSDGTTVLIRDSKYLRDPSNDPERQPIIAITPAQWQSFVDAVAGHSADVTEPRIAFHADGSATLWASDGTRLDYFAAEWDAFSLGVIDGEFDDLLGAAAFS